MGAPRSPLNAGSIKGALIESIGLALTSASCAWLSRVRYRGIDGLPKTAGVLRRADLFPATTHYEDPLWTVEDLDLAGRQKRTLPGIDFRLEEQEAFVREFDYWDELDAIPKEPVAGYGFHFGNGAFETGDAEFLYSFIRKNRPARILEIGSGYSTRMAVEAIRANRAEDPGYACDLTCVEPFCRDWLEQLDATVVRERVELLDPEIFASLQAGDVCFIDSSHIIRPGRDVLYLYLEALPALKPGVYVHVHESSRPRTIRESGARSTGTSGTSNTFLGRFSHATLNGRLSRHSACSQMSVRSCSHPSSRHLRSSAACPVRSG